MILENSDKLKDWLSVVLEPLCDADSSALARYVIALLKKDKSDKDLKRIMIEQLDVFLSEETTRFVERLFDAIASEEYLTMPPTPMSVATATAEMDLEHDLVAIDTAVDIEAVLEAASPPPQLNVIKPDGNQPQQPTSSSSLSSLQQQQQQQQPQLNSNSRETAELAAAASALPALAGSSGTASASTDAKPAFDHKTKDSHNAAITAASSAGTSSSSSHHQQPAHHHHHHNERSGAGAGGSSSLVRSASPPTRSSGQVGGGGGGAYADKENQPRDSRRRRASLRSRSRSRSRSNERSSRRSRSRDRRINEREKNQRQFRNKSPPGAGDSRHHGGGAGGGRRNFDRRRIGGGGNLEDRQRFGQKSRRSHSPRSRSISPDSRNSRRSAERSQAAPPPPPPLLAGGGGPALPLTPAEQHAALSGMALAHQQQQQRQRCRDFDEKGYCVRGETCPWDHGINPVVFEGINNSALMMSMREYNPDAPEIWARGGAPPPGSQPPPPPPQQQQQQQGQQQGHINPFSGNIRPSALMGVPPMGGGPGPADYARGVAGGPPMMPFPFNPTAVTTPLQRQLIPIPVVDGSTVGGPPGAGGASGGVAEMGKRRFELEDTVAIADVPTKRKVPINSRLGPRVNPNMQQHNSSLELRKVPRGLNTIAHLNNHFAKFGKIVNIQVVYEGDPEAAIVTFSTHAEANVAYRSTEAVLNNRFIKVFWHNDANSDGSGNLNNMMGGGVGGGGGGGGGRKNASQYSLHNVPAVPTPNADSAKISNQASSQAAATPLAEAGAGNNNATPAENQAALATTAAPASMRLKLNTTGSQGGAAAGGAGGARANPAVIRKKQEEQQKAMHQLANGLRKRKQELLQGYVKQMKTALELVQRCDPTDPQRANTLETIKVLQATIDKLREDVYADQDQLQAQMQQQQQQQQQQQPPAKKTKEQQKKELLDIELELFAQQQEGNDTTAIQKRLEELQRTLGASLGGNNANGNQTKLPPHFPTGPGGAAAARKRPPTFPEGSTRVDRRTKAIVVTGFAAEEADFVLGHFKHFGEISKHDVDREIPQLILSYSTRLNAEQAVLRGKMYKEKRLQISWAPVVATPLAQPMAAPADKSASVAVAATPLANVAAAADKAELNPKQLMQSVSESESLLGSDTLPELRLEDEEEDEESEDRSWRR